MNKGGKKNMAFYRCVGKATEMIQMIVDDETIISSSQGSNTYSIPSLSTNDSFIISLSGGGKSYTDIIKVYGTVNHSFGGSNYTILLNNSQIEARCTSGSWKTVTCKLSKIDDSQKY